MKHVWTLILILASAIEVLSQSYLDIKSNRSGQLTIDIQVGPQSTLYGISKVAGVKLDELTSINHKNNLSVALHETLVVPISQEKISLSPSALVHPVVLRYTTLSGDNLYRIASMAGMNVSQLMEMNRKSTTHIDIGEQLKIGWIDWPYRVLNDSSTSDHHYNTSKEDLRLIPDIAPIVIHPNRLSSSLSNHGISVPQYDWTSDDNHSVIVTEKGIAYRETSKYPSHEMIVMHPYAKVDSKISLYNPMLQTKVEATVISEMPKESYPEDISVVISPSVASALGALDKRFQVEITYIQ